MRETEIPAPASASPITRRRVVLASVALYLASLALPVMRDTGSGLPPDRGYLILTMGWAGLMIGQFGWFANGFWVAGLIFMSQRHWRGATIAAALAVVVAADSLMLYQTGTPSDSGTSRPTALLVGFYVWWGSLWVLALGALVLWRGRRSAEVRFREVPVVDPIGG